MKRDGKAKSLFHGGAMAALVVMACAAGGCTQYYHTEPPRSATELYLLSTAVESAVQPLSTDTLRARRVYVDTRFVGEKDHQYLIACVRAKLLATGAQLTETSEKAEIILEMRTPGVSMDRTQFLVGIPGLPVGQLAATAGVPPTTLNTPEFALIKEEKRWGIAGVAYVAYWRETGEILTGSGPHIGRSYREDWSFFGVSRTLSDIPTTVPPEIHQTADLPEE